MASSIDGAQFQIGLGRILSEPDLNERFLADPQGVGAELGLDREQVEALEAAGLPRLRTFAHNLASKRIGLLKKVCPATYELVHRRGRLGELAGGFVRCHRPLASQEHPSRSIRDGFWFVEHLLRLDAAGELGDPLLAEVARFERAMLSVTTLAVALESAEQFAARAAELSGLDREEMLAAYPRQGIHARVEEFGVDVVEVIRALGEEEPIDEVEAAETIVLFSKLPGWRNVRSAAISRRTARLLELCTGVSTTRHVVARLLAESLVEEEPEVFADGCLSMLTQLVQLNAVTFDR